MELDTARVADGVALPLVGGGSALVDADVFEWAQHSRWRLMRGPGTSDKAYVRRSVRRGGRVIAEALHRVVLGLRYGDRSIEGDHINGDTLDNRRCNLRPVTRSQNAQNRQGANRDSYTGLRGVSYYPRERGRKKYRASLEMGGRSIRFGYFATPEEADRAVRAGRAQYMTHSPECVTPQPGKDGT